MKYKIYFSILTILLFGQTDIIKADSRSSSFINIIPNLASNIRFIQTDLTDIHSESSQTIPWITQNLAYTTNGSNCTQDIRILIGDLKAKQRWAIKTLDAWGKIPSGVLQGNIYWLGSPYECEHRLRGLNNSVAEQPFPTRTCIINSGNAYMVRPLYGICVPKSCSANDIVNLINERHIHIPFTQITINLANDSVNCIDPRSYDSTAILTMVILSLITFGIVILSGIHFMYGQRHDPRATNAYPTSYQPILSRTVTETTTDAPQPDNSVDEQDESTPLISRSRPAADSASKSFLNCCSLISNYAVLMRENQPRNIACLNGIRVLSLCWMIFGHTYLYAAYYSDNVITFFNWSRQLWFQIVVQGVFSIDSFFLLSGLLTTFIFFMSKNGNERFSILKFLLHHYVYRYLRYTIFYALILLIYISLSPYLGQNGPLYPIDGTETSTCRHTWWRNLLYINNLFDIRDSCMPVSWFLAVNMQFHWIAPLFLLAAAWKWFLGILVAAAFILVDIIATAIIVSKYNYDHGILSDFYSTKSEWANTTHNYMNDVYMKPWCRLAPYAVGLLLGFGIYELYRRSNTVSWESILPERRSNRSRQIKKLVAWLLALTLFGLCIFSTYGDYNGHSLNRSERIAFLTLSRVAWSLGLSIVIVLCFKGHGGLANQILSHSIFEPLSKLTYGAYLWHLLIVFVNYLSRDQPNHYTLTNLICNWIMHIILAYSFSFLTFLFIELPKIQLLKLVFKRSLV